MDNSEISKSHIPQSQFVTRDYDENIDFKRYISLFISNWYWFAISLFIAFCIAYGINRWSEQVYTVSSTLLIRDDPSRSLTELFPGTQMLRTQQNVNNEIGILKSFHVNYRVMQQLPEFSVVYTSVGRRNIAETQMYKTAPFIVDYNSLEDQVLGRRINIRILSDTTYSLEIDGNRGFRKEMKMGQPFNESGFDFKIVLREGKDFVFDPDLSNKYYFYFVSTASLANRYRRKLSINPVSEEASLIILTTTGFVRQQEADYLNTLMDVYLEFGLEDKNKATDQAIDFIEDQLKIISDSLKITEEELKIFRLSNKLIDISREGSLIQEKYEKLDEERVSLAIRESYYNYLNEYVLSKGESTDIIAPSIMSMTDPLLVKLIDELSQLQKQKRQLAMNHIESAAPLKVIETDISKARIALAENINNSLAALAHSKAENDKRLTDVDKEIRRLPSIEGQMINIQRKFDINNTVYTFLLEKRAEAGITRASNSPDHRKIDEAGYHSSQKIRPRERRNFMVASLLGLFFPFLGIIIIDYLNYKVIDRKDIEKRTSAPIIGYISHNGLKTEVPVISKPGSTLAESFRSVRTSLKNLLKEIKCPIISVSSTITAEGKTFVSTNLAAILAMSGGKILLVGLDLRKPRIHRIFGVNNDKGISSFLMGDTKFEDVIVETELKNLYYAPSGPTPPNPAELIESEAMRKFFEIAKQEFDFIIIDTPPVAIVTDALLVSSVTDFYLFVVRQRYSSKNTVELIDELYKNESVKSLGVVINDISISGYYGYGLRYGYSMGYGYSYGYNYYSHSGKYGYADSAKGYYTEES